jgi:hypothetical protein
LSSTKKISRTIQNTNIDHFVHCSVADTVSYSRELCNICRVLMCYTEQTTVNRITRFNAPISHSSPGSISLYQEVNLSPSGQLPTLYTSHKLLFTAGSSSGTLSVPTALHITLPAHCTHTYCFTDTFYITFYTLSHTAIALCILHFSKLLIN